MAFSVYEVIRVDCLSRSWLVYDFVNAKRHAKREASTPVVLFIILYKVILTFESMDETVWCDHSNSFC